MSRYEELAQVVYAHKPQTLVEVGVHNGERAHMMCSMALRWFPGVTYFGFDVFETEGEEFHAEVFNGKGIPSQEQAEANLAGLAELYPDFRHTFMVGRTQDTLHGNPVATDLAFIDGDHRVEAIAHDFLALRNCRTVVFDDYYERDSAGQRPDIKALGCNRIVDAYLDAGDLATCVWKVTLGGAQDPVREGGNVRIAVFERYADTTERWDFTDADLLEIVA